MAIQIKVKVTQKDIDRGDHGNCDSCPIALAIKREFITDEVIVLPTRIILNGYHLIVSKKAQTFIENFDKSRPVKPPTFILKGPEV